MLEFTWRVSGGLFAREGLAVDIVQPGEVYAPAAVLGGVADFGVDFQEYLTLLAAEQSGLGLGGRYFSEQHVWFCGAERRPR